MDEVSRRQCEIAGYEIRRIKEFPYRDALVSIFREAVHGNLDRFYQPNPKIRGVGVIIKKHGKGVRYEGGRTLN